MLRPVVPRFLFRDRRTAPRLFRDRDGRGRSRADLRRGWCLGRLGIFHMLFDDAFQFRMLFGAAPLRWTGVLLPLRTGIHRRGPRFRRGRLRPPVVDVPRLLFRDDHRRAAPRLFRDSLSPWCLRRGLGIRGPMRPFHKIRKTMPRSGAEDFLLLSIFEIVKWIVAILVLSRSRKTPGAGEDHWSKSCCSCCCSAPSPLCLVVRSPLAIRFLVVRRKPVVRRNPLLPTRTVLSCPRGRRSCGMAALREQQRTSIR